MDNIAVLDSGAFNFQHSAMREVHRCVCCTIETLSRHPIENHLPPFSIFTSHDIESQIGRRHYLMPLRSFLLARPGRPLSHQSLSAELAQDRQHWMATLLLPWTP